MTDDNHKILLDTKQSPGGQLPGSSAAPVKFRPCNKGNLVNNSNSADLESMKHKCQVCSKSFSTRSNLNRHAINHSDYQLYKCKKCPRTFEGSDAFRVHMVSDHRKVYLCGECGAKFAIRSNLNQHRRLKHSKTLDGLQQPLMCPIEGCKRSFVHKSKFEDHVFFHSDKKPHSCEICSKAFSSRYSRDMHQGKCSGEISFECDVCHVALFDRTALKRHKEAQHDLANYRYVCNCGKKFKYPSSLIRHKKVAHTS